MAERDERIFPALPQRRQRAHEQGEIARSRGLTTAISFAAFAIIAASAEPFLGRQLLGVFRAAAAASSSDDIAVALGQSLILPVTCMLSIAVMLSAIAVAGTFLQGGIVFAPARVIPDFTRLNPMSFFARIFSTAGAVELAKDAIKVGLVVIISWKIAEGAFAAGESGHGIGNALIILSVAIHRLLYSCAALAIVIAIADYAYKSYKYEGELRMTRQEFLDELKQEEGNPQVKRAVRRAQRRHFKRVRGIHQAASASVVITNPTHLAVALRYRRGFDQAPLMVAKGAGEGAQRIVAIARLAAVPVLENRALARALFIGVEVGEQIPPRLYRAVAEVLAMIMRMERQHRSSGAQEV
ncbi:MAG: EscU/YscU/HrcU family type III secretion system export apparatus switch protein [Deltaproteobacteria bacterium]|nr:EscU/YscU/HrcU family type III secretion system export apparatus switch protein [Deltaproteobacteria bacterium]